MTLPVTLALMIAAALVIALAAWRSGQPADPGRIRMIPWTLVMVITAGMFMLLLAHMFSHFGIETGQGFMRR
jgi:preprotein translocase subunit SecY